MNFTHAGGIEIKMRTWQLCEVVIGYTEINQIKLFNMARLCMHRLQAVSAELGKQQHQEESWGCHSAVQAPAV